MVMKNQDIEFLCNGKEYTIVTRENSTPFEDELKWLQTNIGLPIMYPGDGNKWGGIVRQKDVSQITHIVDYFFLDSNSALMFKLAMD